MPNIKVENQDDPAADSRKFHGLMRVGGDPLRGDYIVPAKISVSEIHAHCSP
jgi:hypothetical protein